VMVRRVCRSCGRAVMLMRDGGKRLRVCALTFVVEHGTWMTAEVILMLTM